MKRTLATMAAAGTLLAAAGAQASTGARLSFDHDSTAPRPTRFYHVTDPGAMHNLSAIERAITDQVNHDVAARWTIPRIAFRSYGIPITIVSQDWFDRQGLIDVAGFHSVNVTGEPYIVSTPDSALLDHEVIEATVDPSGSGPEIADPVEGNIQVDEKTGVVLEDFVYPNWYRRGSRGPWDWLGDVNRGR